MYVLGMNTSYLIVGVVGFCSLGASALAGSTVSLQADHRITTMDYDIAWFDDFGNLAGFNQLRSWSPGEFDDFMFDQSNTLGDTASMHVTQDSSVSGMVFAGSGMAHATSTPDPEIEYLIFGMFGMSSYAVDFTVSEQTDFAVDVDLFASADLLDITSRMFVYDLSNESFVLQAEAGEGDLAVQQMLTLEAGSYRFLMEARVGPGETAAVHSASFDGSMRVVPAPSALFVVMTFGAIASRRRR